MNESMASQRPLFRRSIRIRRVATIALGLLVVTYLALITVVRSDDMVSLRQFMLFGALWLLGLGALILVGRSLRRLGRERERERNLASELSGGADRVASPPNKSPDLTREE